METTIGPARTTATALRDGSTVHLRRADAGDAAAVLELPRSLSPHSRAMRFATTAVDLPNAARGAVEHAGVIAFVADGSCVGHLWYVPTMQDRAEIAVVVADRYHGRGLGTILLKKLAESAALRGVRAFEAYVVPENIQMTALLRGSGFAIRTRPDLDGLTFEIGTSAPTRALRLDGSSTLKARVLVIAAARGALPAVRRVNCV